eukprot:scaffold2235_cov288-Pavlova_lutheri.AAC.3
MDLFLVSQVRMAPSSPPVTMVAFPSLDTAITAPRCAPFTSNPPLPSRLQSMERTSPSSAAKAKTFSSKKQESRSPARPHAAWPRFSSRPPSSE